MQLAINDYVEVYGQHTQGASLNTDVSATGASSLSVVFERT
jgi:hypothetical protein